MNRILFFIMLCALWQTAQGQGTKADYERAYALRGVIGGKVFRDRFTALWLGDHPVSYTHLRAHET